MSTVVVGDRFVSGTIQKVAVYIPISSAVRTGGAKPTLFPLIPFFLLLVLVIHFCFDIQESAELILPSAFLASLAINRYLIIRVLLVILFFILVLFPLPFVPVRIAIHMAALRILTSILIATFLIIFVLGTTIAAAVGVIAIHLCPILDFFVRVFIPRLACRHQLTVPKCLSETDSLPFSLSEIVHEAKSYH